MAYSLSKLTRKTLQFQPLVLDPWTRCAKANSDRLRPIPQANGFDVLEKAAIATLASLLYFGTVLFFAIDLVIAIGTAIFDFVSYCTSTNPQEPEWIELHPAGAAASTA